MAKNQTSSKTLKPDTDKNNSTILEFDDNHLLAQLVGEHDRYLARIEQALDVSVASRGNKMAVSGSKSAQATAKTVPSAWRATHLREMAAVDQSQAGQI